MHRYNPYQSTSPSHNGLVPLLSTLGEIPGWRVERKPVFTVVQSEWGALPAWVGKYVVPASAWSQDPFVSLHDSLKLVAGNPQMAGILRWTNPDDPGVIYNANHLPNPHDPPTFMSEEEAEHALDVLCRTVWVVVYTHRHDGHIACVYSDLELAADERELCMENLGHLHCAHMFTLPVMPARGLVISPSQAWRDARQTQDEVYYSYCGHPQYGSMQASWVQKFALRTQYELVARLCRVWGDPPPVKPDWL